MRIPLKSGISSRDGTSAKDSGITNMLEAIHDGQGVLETRPGMLLDSVVAEGNPGGLVSFDDALFSIYDATIYHREEVVAPSYFNSEAFAETQSDGAPIPIVTIGNTTSIFCALNPDQPTFPLQVPTPITKINFVDGEYSGEASTGFNTYVRVLFGVIFLTTFRVVSNEQFYCVFPVSGPGGAISTGTSNGIQSATEVFPHPISPSELADIAMVCGDGRVVLSLSSGKKYYADLTTPAAGADWLPLPNGPVFKSMTFTGGKFYGVDQSNNPNKIWSMDYSGGEWEQVHQESGSLSIYGAIGFNGGLVFSVLDPSDQTWKLKVLGQDGEISVVYSRPHSSNSLLLPSYLSDQELFCLDVFYSDPVQSGAVTVFPSNAKFVSVSDGFSVSVDPADPSVSNPLTDVPRQMFENGGKWFVLYMRTTEGYSNGMMVFPVNGGFVDFGDLVGNVFDFAQSTI